MKNQVYPAVICVLLYQNQMTIQCRLCKYSNLGSSDEQTIFRRSATNDIGHEETSDFQSWKPPVLLPLLCVFSPLPPFMMEGNAKSHVGVSNWKCIFPIQVPRTLNSTHGSIRGPETQVKCPYSANTGCRLTLWPHLMSPSLLPSILRPHRSLALHTHSARSTWLSAFAFLSGMLCPWIFAFVLSQLKYHLLQEGCSDQPHLNWPPAPATPLSSW